MKYNMWVALVALMIFSMTYSFAQTLPEKAMGKPKIFNNEEESSRWDDIAANRSWGELSNKPWKVYIDREGVKAHTQSNSSSSVKTNCKFLAPYYVAKIENGYALLFTQSYVNESLAISSDAKVCGWVSVDQLLLWTVCPRTPNQVYRKALIVKDVETGKSSSDRNPPFYTSPSCNTRNREFRATQLQIYFVYKETADAALLFLGRSLNDDKFTINHGWMNSSEYTNWNERLCFEPKFGPDVKNGQFAAIFDSHSNARDYKNYGIGSLVPIWREELPKKRWAPDYTRFPVLSMNQYIAEVATINSFSSGKTTTTAEFARLTRMVDDIENKLRTVNVVFVMDGTSSMKDYFRPMALAIQNAMKHDGMKEKKINFGAVVYRNYADEKGGKYNLFEKKPITSNYSSVADWLIGQNCGSVELVDSYEAMYYGLNQAADMFNTSETCNFVILVGDAASKEPDPKGITVEKIAAKFASKEINFIAFQVNHQNKDAYDDYTSQVMRIMTSELKTLRQAKMTRNDFKLSNNLWEYAYENGWPIFSAGFKFAEIGQSEASKNLENLIETKILDFIKLAEENKTKFNEALVVLASGESGPQARQVTKDVENYLRTRYGWTQEDIAKYKESGASIKLKGYTSRISSNEEVFTTSVFISGPELKLLIRSLESLNRTTTTNPRKDLQDALKNLASIYLGQIDNASDINVDDLMEAMGGIGSLIGKSPLRGINIGQVTNTNVVHERKIEEFKSMISEDVVHLKEIEKDKTCYFFYNDELYYYILVKDMPLVRERQSTNN